jgi:hypothetical protein
VPLCQADTLVSIPINVRITSSSGGVYSYDLSAPLGAMDVRARPTQIGRRVCLLLVLIMASWVLPALGGTASATSPASSREPTYHYFHMSADLYNPGIVIAGACNGRETKSQKDDVALDWAEGISGHCSGDYALATTTAPFKGPIMTSHIDWTSRTDGGLDLNIAAASHSDGRIMNYGSISGWISGRTSGDFHVTSADVGIWHADSSVTTPDVSGAAAGTKGGPLFISANARHEFVKPHIDVDISGYLLYSTPPPPRDYHFFRVHFNGICAGTYGIGTATCVGHYDEGSSAGFADEDGTVAWQTLPETGDPSRFVLQFKTATGEVICDMGNRSRPECRDVTVRVDSLGAEGPIYTGDGTGGGHPIGTPGGELLVNAQGGGNLDLSGYLSYASWVPADWPPS